MAMRLHSLLLRDDEKELLDKIYSSLATHPEIHAIIYLEFKAYLQAIKHDMPKSTASRILISPKSTSPDRLLLIYDYSRELLFPKIMQDLFVIPKIDEIKLLISSLIKKREERNIPSFWLPQHITKLNYMWRFMREVPNCFINEFIGYRRTNSDGNILSYFLKIDTTDNSFEVTFENIYVHNKRETRVRGFGLFLNNTLYLIGHATIDTDKKPTSSGMRVLALKQYLKTDHVCGIVMSASKDTPLAARVLMIPARYHARWSQRSAENENKDDNMHEILLSRLSDNERLQDIISNVKKSDIIHSEEFISMMVENTTPTVPGTGFESRFHKELAAQMYKLRRRYEKETDNEADIGNTTSEIIGTIVASSVEEYMRSHKQNLIDDSD